MNEQLRWFPAVYENGQPTEWWGLDQNDVLVRVLVPFGAYCPR